jgi:predicted Zn-dependent protease
VPNWLSTHPEPLQRVQEIQPLAEQARASRPGLTRDREALLRRLDGIIYGDNPDQGIVRGSTFLHRDLRFRLDFPADWDIQNSPEQVVAKAPRAEIYMVMQLVRMPRGRDIREIALSSMQQAGFRSLQGSRVDINGLDSFLGVYEGQSQEGVVNVRAAHIPYNKQVFVVAGLTARNLFQQADNGFLTSIRSFRSLSAAEAEKILPNRIDLYVVRAGDTWQSIADRSGGVIKPTTLAIMNNADPGSQPQVGTRIKIVTGG